jgi:hypothetical protein
MLSTQNYVISTTVNGVYVSSIKRMTNPDATAGEAMSIYLPAHAAVSPLLRGYLRRKVHDSLLWRRVYQRAIVAAAAAPLAP